MIPERDKSAFAMFLRESKAEEFNESNLLFY